MRTFRRILFGLFIFLVVALVAGYWYERPMLLTGTGYAAHNACAVRDVAGRKDPASDLPPNPLVPVLRTGGVDPDGQRGSILGVLGAQTAWFAEGFGCTLASDPPNLGDATIVTKPNPLLVGGTVDPPAALAPAIDKAFGGALPAKDRAALRTRGVVVMRDGQVVAERYADGFTPDTPQLGWSMTKSVANLLVGRLVKEGKVKITDDHLRPEWTDGRAKITIDDLMRMTSGLEWDETYALGTPITRMLYLESDMGSYVASQKQTHALGDYQQYSSGSTTLMCAILADKTGVKADLPRRELFEPLGLGTAVMEPDAVGTPVCSSYMWGTPREWAVIGQFALDDGVVGGQRLLPEGWMKESTTPKPVKESDEVSYAAGWRSNTTADGKIVDKRIPADSYWAQGHDGQWLFVVPSERLVVVRMGFSPDVEDEGAFDLVHDVVAAGR